MTWLLYAWLTMGAVSCLVAYIAVGSLGAYPWRFRAFLVLMLITGPCVLLATIALPDLADRTAVRLRGSWDRRAQIEVESDTLAELFIPRE